MKTIEEINKMTKGELIFYISFNYGFMYVKGKKTKKELVDTLITLQSI